MSAPTREFEPSERGLGRGRVSTVASFFAATLAAAALTQAPGVALAQSRSSRAIGAHASQGAWPQVHLGAVDASPGLANAVVSRVLQRNLARMNRCYEDRGLAADPNLHGRATLLLTIEANGAVSRVAVETPEVLLPVAQCIQASVPSFGRFPRPAGLAVVTVSAPLHFGTAAPTGVANARVRATR